MRLYDMRAIFVACSCGRLGGPCGWLIQFLAARVNHSGFVLGFICCLQIPPEREREDHDPAHSKRLLSDYLSLSLAKD